MYTKKDELEDAEKCPDGECDGKKDDKEEKEDSDDDEECEEGACESAVLSIANESFILPDQTEALENYLNELVLESDIALEGLHKDMKNTLNAALKTAKEKIKEAEAYAKQGDSAKTRAAVDECIRSLESAKDEFTDLASKGTVTDAVLGNVLYTLQGVGIVLGVGLGLMTSSALSGAAVAGAKGAAAAAKMAVEPAIIGGSAGAGLGTTINVVVSMVRAFKRKKAGGEINSSDFDMWVTRTTTVFNNAIKEYKRWGDKLVKKADKREVKNANKADTSANESFVNALESLMIDSDTSDAEWLAATEGANWQSLKGLVGKKTRQARSLVKAAKTAAKSGDNKTAISNLTQAKKMFGEVKSDLQKLPKDMWDTIASWAGIGWIQIIYVMAKGAKWDEQENKNINVATVCTYLDGAMKKCDEKIAALRGGKATESATDVYMFE